jgi:hypothetical protein
MRYGSDGQSVYLRLDFVEGVELDLSDTELRIGIQPCHGGAEASTLVTPLGAAVNGQAVEVSCGRICEIRVPLSAANVPNGHDLRFQLSLWQGGLPMEALPPQGWIEFSTAEPADWMA